MGPASLCRVNLDETNLTDIVTLGTVGMDNVDGTGVKAACHPGQHFDREDCPGRPGSRHRSYGVYVGTDRDGDAAGDLWNPRAAETFIRRPGVLNAGGPNAEIG